MNIVYTPQAWQDKQNFAFDSELQQALYSIKLQPKQAIALVGDLAGAYSKTIIGNSCLIYQIVDDKIKVLCITK
jgi:Txe/YoeB family toxin of Txe-Axe toxin-antitoxin module